MFLMAIVAISCSKKVEIKGKISQGTPLERIEIIEASGVGTLPLLNIGVDAKGEFAGEFEAPKSGMYILTYGGNATQIYLKGGQTLGLYADAMAFPTEMKITGDAKANNDFLKATDKAIETYTAKLNGQELLMKKEDAFIKEYQKIKTDFLKLVDATADKHDEDTDARDYKKDEVATSLLPLLYAYETQHSIIANDPKYRASEKFKTLKKEEEKDNDRYIKDFPRYREFKLNELNEKYTKYTETLPKNPKVVPMVSQVFADFLKTQKDLSSTAKDYFLAYVLAQADLNYMNQKNYDKITKLIDDNISDAQIKTDLKHLQTTLMGYKVGSTPELELQTKEGKSTNLSDLKGKPTLVMFYASWNPHIALTAIPILKEVTDFYKSKINFAYINLDDTNEQFTKTSKELLKGFAGEHYWIKGGVNSKTARDFGIYAFKMPSYILLDKDGKFYGRPFFNLGDPEFVEIMTKLTGIKAPEVAPRDTSGSI
ncbi:MAG: redoxin domain-containing protein [Bergeyella zoohelcum]|nr:redoxin domain-containing protein [Bergeyella zoohelcum]